MEILQIVPGPLPDNLLVQDFAVPAAFATAMDFGQVLEEEPGAVEQRQQRSVMIGGHRDLNMSATNIPSACRIANIALNDEMILPYNANPGRMEFSERTPLGAHHQG
jgi:hypothetical protein